MSKISLQDLYNEWQTKRDALRCTSDADEIKTLRCQMRKLQSRIANRERYSAMRSLGFVKTPYGWE